jgi:hypothetical protein
MANKKIKVFTTKREYFPNREFFVANVDSVEEAIDVLTEYSFQTSYASTKDICADSFDIPVEDAENAYKAHKLCVEALVQRPDQISSDPTKGDDLVDEVYYALMFKSFLGHEDDGPLVQECRSYFWAVDIPYFEIRKFYSPEKDQALFARYCGIEAYLKHVVGYSVSQGKPMPSESDLEANINSIGFNSWVPAELIRNPDLNFLTSVTDIFRDSTNHTLYEWLKALFKAITSWRLHFKGVKSLVNLIAFIHEWISTLVPDWIDKWKIFAWYGPERLRFYNFYEPDDYGEKFVQPTDLSYDQVKGMLRSMNDSWTAETGLVEFDFRCDSKTEAKKIVHWFQASQKNPPEIADDCEDSKFLKLLYALIGILSESNLEAVFGEFRQEDMNARDEDGEYDMYEINKAAEEFCVDFVKELEDVSLSEMRDFIVSLSEIFQDFDNNTFFDMRSIDGLTMLTSYDDSFWGFLSSIIRTAASHEENNED